MMLSLIRDRLQTHLDMVAIHRFIPLKVKKERDNFVKIHTNDLEKAFSVSASIVKKYYKDYEE